MKTKYLIGVIAIAVIFFVCAKPTTADFSSEEDKTIALADSLPNSIVTITVSEGTGTGFYISPNQIITNHHVTGDLTSIFFTNNKGKTCIGDMIKTSSSPDLSLIKTDCIGSPLKLAESVKVGQSVLIMGNPLDEPYFLSKGIVSLLVDGYVLTDTFMDHGSSGSPMVNLNGEVVGVVKGKFKDTTVGAGIDVKALNRFIKG